MNAADLWRVAFTQWDLVTLPDLRQFQGIDMDAPGEWHRRSWASLYGAILSLLDVGESRLARAMRRLNEERSPAGGERGA